MKIGPLTLPTFSSPAKIGVVAALVLALSASGGFGALFFGASGGASAPIEKGDTGGVPTAVPGDSAITGDRIDVIRTGTFSLEVENVDTSLTKLTSVVKSQGGYVSGSYRYTDTSTPYLTVTFRVPAASFDAAVLALRAEGTVLSEQISTYEVTMQLVDLEARLRNLRASETALLELMSRATTVSDVLAVQTQLTSVRSDIESYDAQRASLADQVAMTTVSVTISPIGSSIGNATNGFDLGKEVARAVANLIAVGRTVIIAAINLVIVVLPIALVGALAGGLLGRTITPLFALLRRLMGVGVVAKRTVRRR
ncbi:MAG: DUF4349 domain-containing protein [Chloroflexi bacterium]|nr:DUF4349 domain-containing protein [Chloroflexota bacterium]